MLASIIYNYGKFCDDFKSTLKLGAYKVKAESDELYEKLVRKHFYGRSDDIPASDKTEHLKGCG